MTEPAPAAATPCRADTSSPTPVAGGAYSSRVWAGRPVEPTRRQARPGQRQQEDNPSPLDRAAVLRLGQNRQASRTTTIRPPRPAPPTRARPAAWSSSDPAPGGAGRLPRSEGSHRMSDPDHTDRDEPAVSLLAENYGSVAVHRTLSAVRAEDAADPPA